MPFIAASSYLVASDTHRPLKSLSPAASAPADPPIQHISAVHSARGISVSEFVHILSQATCHSRSAQNFSSHILSRHRSNHVSSCKRVEFRIAKSAYINDMRITETSPSVKPVIISQFVHLDSLPIVWRSGRHRPKRTGLPSLRASSDSESAGVMRLWWKKKRKDQEGRARWQLTRRNRGWELLVGRCGWLDGDVGFFF